MALSLRELPNYPILRGRSQFVCCRGETAWSGVKKKKAGLNFRPAFAFNPGGDLRSHTVARAVSSAQRGLTTVFGMGTGVTLAI